MAYIDKLLNKFNKAKQAINSLKGIQSKIQSINYTTALDALGESQDKAKTLLDSRRTSLQKSLSGAGQLGANYCKEPPKVRGGDLVYPVHDELSNYIVFNSRPRRNRGAEKSVVHTERQVALYVPDTLISQSVVNYTADGVSPMARALNEVVESFQKGGMGDGFKSMGDQANKIATKAAQQMANQLTGGLSNLKGGRAVNPMQEQLLQGIPFRSWDFTFDFWPKSMEEANNVNKIIYVFRSSMLPDAYSEKLSADITPFDLIGGEDEKDALAVTDQQLEVETNASYFNYPNVFDISFEGPLGDKIDGFLPAVCTTANVDYTGGQKFSTFADGQPVHIQLTLNFLEIKTMTLGNYEAVRAGGSGTLDDQSILDRGSRTLQDVGGGYGYGGANVGKDGTTKKDEDDG